MAENAQTDIKKLSFERALEELESIVKRLEEGKVPLEESVTIEDGTTETLYLWHIQSTEIHEKADG